jgi:hypothetical protein
MPEAAPVMPWNNPFQESKTSAASILPLAQRGSKADPQHYSHAGMREL